MGRGLLLNTMYYKSTIGRVELSLKESVSLPFSIFDLDRKDLSTFIHKKMSCIKLFHIIDC